MTLETKSTKHAENVIRLMPSDLGKRVFEWNGFKISLKPEARTSVNKCQKTGVKIQEQSMTNGPRS